MALDNEPQVSAVYLGSVDPTGGPQYTIFKAPAACRARVLGVYLLNGTARAKHGTDFNTFTLNRFRAGSGTAVGLGKTEDVAAGVALADMVPFSVGLTSAALSELAAGDTLQLVFTEGAVDLDLTECSVFTEWVAGSGSGM